MFPISIFELPTPRAFAHLKLFGEIRKKDTPGGKLQWAAWERLEAPLINWRKMVGILSKSADLSRK